MNVLVAGAEGPIGRLLCREILIHNNGVTALVADESAAPDLRRMGCEVVVGDMTGRVGRAFHGVQACVIADGLPKSSKNADPALVDQTAVTNIIDAAEENLPRASQPNVPHAETHEAGVGRLVLLSFLDPTKFVSAPAGEQRFHRTVKGDRRLMESPLAWSIIRPGEVIRDGNPTGKIEAGTDLKTWRDIQAGDVAKTALYALLTGDADRKSIEITGGETPIPAAVRGA